MPDPAGPCRADVTKAPPFCNVPRYQILATERLLGTLQIPMPGFVLTYDLTPFADGGTVDLFTMAPTLDRDGIAATMRPVYLV